MFPRRKRLPRSEFETAMMSGKRFSSSHFTAVVSKKATGYAVVVSKKTAKLSVTRHRIKRRVLSALRSLTALPPSAILYPRASVLDMRYDEIKIELTKLLS